MRLLSEAFKNKEMPVKLALGIFQPFIHRPVTVRLPLNMPVKPPSLFNFSQLLIHNMPDLPEIVLIMNNLSTITAQNNFCYSKNVSLHTYLWPIYGIQLVISSAFSNDLLPTYSKTTTWDHSYNYLPFWWVEFGLQIDSGFILFAEINQILLKFLLFAFSYLSCI